GAWRGPALPNPWRAGAGPGARRRIPLLTPLWPPRIFRCSMHETGKAMEAQVELREFFDKDAINLDLKGETKDEVLKELIGLLNVDEKSEAILFKMLRRRENLGSTGIGRGIAIPHCRS